MGTFGNLYLNKKKVTEMTLKCVVSNLYISSQLSLNDNDKLEKMLKFTFLDSEMCCTLGLAYLTSAHRDCRHYQ